MNKLPLKTSPKILALLISSTFLSSAGFSASLQAETELEHVDIHNDAKVKQSNRNERMLKLKNDIVHTEIITEEKIEKKHAASLAQAIENEPGVKVNTDCSLCGVKRVTLSGLKGEHTTIMINGVPNSSLMEGFYGFDAIPTAGVTAIEVARGAGASLVSPEAIGGVVNVVTAKPYNDRLMFDISRGTNNYHKYQFVGTKVSADKNTAFALAAQSDQRGQVDVDNNYVNESPELTNRAMNLQVWHKLSEKNKIDFRIEDQYSEVFGGPMLNTSFAMSKFDARTQGNGDADFIDGHVKNKPTAGTTARDFLENIISTKQSYTGKWTHDVSDDLQTQVIGSYVDATLDSVYEHITYKADQDIYYLDGRADYFLNDQHALTFGVDFKKDDYSSVSTGGTANVRGPAGDSYKLTTTGAYIKDFWTPSNSLEVSAALRIDQIDVEFIDQNREFKETILSPRFHARYLHDFSWTSRFSAGQGYRVPLAFFETDHGIVDNPLIMDVDKLEKSNSFQYSLDYNSAQTGFETSYSWTSVDNLAMIDGSDSVNTKIINAEKTGVVQHLGVSANHQIDGHWAIEASAEKFMYDGNYRDTFGIIPTEERLSLTLDYDGHGHDWDVSTTVTWIGSRNYADYSGADYGNHYKDKLNTKNNGDSSPAYFTVDLKVARDIAKNWSLYAGANNLLDYTQTGSGSSPLFYDTDGAVDVTHIWGPLRGREIYAGIKADF